MKNGRTIRPKLGEEIVVLSTGTKVQLTYDAMLFNASALYRNSWKIGLATFMETPIFRGIVSLLREEYEIPLLVKEVDSKTCEHKADIFIHMGFLALIMLDLNILKLDELWLFHQEVRTLVARQVAMYFHPDRRMIVPVSELDKIMSNHEISELSDLADHLMSHATPTTNCPTPWIDVIDNRSVDLSVLNGALHVVYTTMDIVLAKRFALLTHCKSLGLIDENASRKLPPSLPCSPTLDRIVSQIGI